MMNKVKNIYDWRTTLVLFNNQIALQAADEVVLDSRGKHKHHLYSILIPQREETKEFWETVFAKFPKLAECNLFDREACGYWNEYLTKNDAIPRQQLYEALGSSADYGYDTFKIILQKFFPELMQKCTVVTI